MDEVGKVVGWIVALGGAAAAVISALAMWRKASLPDGPPAELRPHVPREVEARKADDPRGVRTEALPRRRPRRRTHVPQKDREKRGRAYT